MKPKTILQLRRLVLNEERRRRGHCREVSEILWCVAAELNRADQLQRDWETLRRILKINKVSGLKSTPVGSSVFFDEFSAAADPVKDMQDAMRLQCNNYFAPIQAVLLSQDQSDALGFTSEDVERSQGLIKIIELGGADAGKQPLE